MGSPGVQRETDLARQTPGDVRRLARWMDEAFVVPGTRFRVGWDGLLGLIPGAGDLLTTLPALWIVLRSVNLGVSKVVAARMVLNILIENVIGAVPLIGDLFDFAWKANRRNLGLLERYLADPSVTRRRSSISLAGTVTLLIAVAAGLVAIPIFILIWLIEAFGIGSV